MKLNEIERMIILEDEKIKLHSSMTPHMSPLITGCLRDVHFPIMNDIIKKTGANRILEIGFNAGHSCLLWLLSSSDTNVVGLDVHYPSESVNYLKEKYGDRFSFVHCDSAELSKKDFIDKWENEFDLIFIDGDHSYEAVTRDLKNSLRLNPKYIVFDDVRHISHSYIETIINECEELELVDLYEFEACIALTKVNK
jgi:predicted O-methyltransferase YrrM